MESMVHKVQLDQRELKVLLVKMALMVKLVLLVKLVLQVLKVQ
tara:strand:+ start:882 stop:1010 length:129 start_codon:yes stop_codon:yes gene_type:complete